jgi:hypothetical protein
LRCEGRVGTPWNQRFGEQCRRNARFTNGKEHVCYEHAKQRGAFDEETYKLGGSRHLKPGWKMIP